MDNTNLLKEAIIEAKALHQASIQNAKQALEESLTPKVKSMLAKKLQEMSSYDDNESFTEDYLQEEDELEDTTLDTENEPNMEEDDIDVGELSGEELKKLIRSIIAQETGEMNQETEIEDNERPEEEEEYSGEEEEIDLNELLRELDQTEVDTLKEKKDDEEKSDMYERKSKDSLYEVKTLRRKYRILENKFKQALKVVSKTKQQLQEVNLLNAKLMHITKLSNSHRLSEGQLANLITVIDRAESVKEVNLVYEAVSKQFATRTKANRLQESKMAFASKATGDVNVRKTRSHEQEQMEDEIKRLQHLAGIKKSN